MKIILLGDSFTQGYLVEPGECWADRLEYGDLLPGWEVDNQGMNGDSTMGMDLRLREQILGSDGSSYGLPDEAPPERILITGGINDLIYGGSKEDVEHYYASMIMTCREQGVQPILGLEPAIDPNLAGVFWMAGIDYYRVAEEQAVMTEDLRSMAKENDLYVVDFYKAVEALKRKRPDERIYQDGLHVTPEVHFYLAEFAAAELTAIPLPY